MKIASTFIFLIFISITVFSQSQNDYSYSAGIDLFSYREYPKLLNEVRNSESYRVSGFKGLTFKFNDNQISYRLLGAIYSNNDYSFKNMCTDCETVTGKFRQFTTKLGFERNIIYGLIQPFYGLDLGFKKISFSGTSRDQGNTPLYDVEIEKNGGVIYPFLGFKVNFIKARLTFSAEAGIDMLYSHDKETKITANSLTVDNYKRWGFYNKPLGMLGLQYNFGIQ